MVDDASKMKPPSPWVPTDNKVDLAVLGKLAEELAECSAIVARCIIQGVDGLDPETGVPNREKLWKEAADVRATLDLLDERFELPADEIAERRGAKRAHKRQWFELIRQIAGHR